MPELIYIENSGTLCCLTLNRPAQKNALSIELLKEFCVLLRREITTDTTAVIISGQGGCFSAGADLSELKGTSEDLAVDDAIAIAVQEIRKTPVPVIAAIDGPCIGAAVDICLACDLRVGSKDAYLHIPATRLGLLYNPDAIARIAGTVSPDTLFRLLLVGEKFSAQEARRVGLFSYLVAEGTSREAAIVIAQSCATNQPQAVAATKRLLNALQDGQYDSDYWNRVRRGILDSSERRAAVEKLKQR